MVEGVALVHIEPDQHRTLEEFYRKLRSYRNGGSGWRLPTMSVGVMRPVWRIFSTKSQASKEFNLIVQVTAANEGELYEIFKTLEGLGCHVDGYG